MATGLLAVGFGLLGFVLGCFGLYRTIATRNAVLRGGRRISLQANPSLYWTNFVALCILVAISISLIYVGLIGFA